MSADRDAERLAEPVDEDQAGRVSRGHSIVGRHEHLLRRMLPTGSAQLFHLPPCPFFVCDLARNDRRERDQYGENGRYQVCSGEGGVHLVLLSKGMIVRIVR
jgi:hypothetical protein